ncbi:hypothetical protein [Streptomyces sp. NPDC047841]|uniref:hypothetical protein n=1 Tax=Streptomyces sp. NPDC047841 TaxID=3154708 RepID=UPI0034555A31
MTAHPRLTLRCLRLLIVLTATALPAHGTAVAHGGAPLLAARPDTARPSATGHREQAGTGGTRQGTSKGAAPEHAHALTDVPEHASAGHTAPGHAARDRGRPDQGPPPEASPRETSSEESEESEEESSDEASSDEASPDRTASANASTAVPMPSDSASASVHPYRPLASVEPSRAGSRAGEGRMRPGRPDGPEIEDEDDDPPPATPAAQPQEPETAEVPSGPPSPLETGPDPTGSPRGSAAEQAAPSGEAPTEPVLRILPLGSGLVLIGLGLGLALLGLRLRKS